MLSPVKKLFKPAVLSLLFSFLLMPGLSNAQQSDNGNGTYTNPVIWSDFPDNDVIRVKDTYYMVATSMFYFPGVPILKSKDLVNWEYATNAVQEFKQHPFYDLNGGNRYAHGQWASSLRYHNGKFYVLFLTLDEGGMLLTADKAEGPWQLHKLPKAFYDAGLFFDEDGRTYVVHGYSKLSITEVDHNLAPISKDSVIVDKVQRKGLEGSHVYHVNGYYYIYATYGGGDGYQVALRSKNIYGPYEEKVVLKDDMNLPGKGVHQGGLVQTQTGEWWSIIFQDRDGVGRVPTLQPVTWINDWPIVGKNGKAVVTHTKPNVGRTWPVKVLPTSDEFGGSYLGPQWSWNHNPDNASWSLTENKGYLRLKTAKIVKALPEARNTLTQRMFGPYSIGVAEFKIGNMINGDVCGLGVFQNPYAYVGVAMKNNRKQIIMVDNGTVIDSAALDNNTTSIYLKANAVTTTDQVTFSYSLDNVSFKPIGHVFTMKFSLKMFTGNRFALFNYATEKKGGWVDINWFRMTTHTGPPNLFKSSQP
jgi:beta-xylosidase